MNALLAAMLGGWEMVLIFAVFLMLFGAKKLPELARGLGHGIKEFKKATSDVTEEMHRALEEEPPPPPRKIASCDSQPVATGSAPSSTVPKS
jgi:sec-independent protein translocase protein TatA